MEELDISETNFAIVQSRDDVGDLLLTLTGELDISSAESFRTAVERLVEGGPARLVFDLTDLTFMDSSGIAVMVYAANKVGAVELRHASTIIRRIVEATGLSEILKLDPS
jgi:anti-sigma B factor antagonist